jgi:hypothetical protein
VKHENINEMAIVACRKLTLVYYKINFCLPNASESSPRKQTDFERHRRPPRKCAGDVFFKETKHRQADWQFPSRWSRALRARTSYST